MIKRRVTSVFSVLVLFGTLTVSFPVLLFFALMVDVIRGVRFASVRFLFFMEGFLAMEIAGVFVSGIIWAAEFPRKDSVRFQRRNYALQNWWGVTIATMGIRLYGLKLTVEEAFVPEKKPFILFIRHASFIDTFLPIFLISSKFNIRLRYVLKTELLADPCLDIVGNRIPNVFIRRDSEDSDGQISAVKKLGSALSADEGVVIYPEGTRFSRKKKSRILERAKQNGEEAYRFASRFNSVLPPRLGGSLALLEEAPEVDVVFCAHTGLEATMGFRQLLSGELINTEIRVRFHRVAGNDIPVSSEQKKAWFVEKWCEVDEIVTRWKRGKVVVPEHEPEIAT
jgi:1-acyl-sn-glycerol-3-phosphate acyltransferase